MRVAPCLHGWTACPCSICLRPAHLRHFPYQGRRGGKAGCSDRCLRSALYGRSHDYQSYRVRVPEAYCSATRPSELGPSQSSAASPFCTFQSPRERPASLIHASASNCYRLPLRATKYSVHHQSKIKRHSRTTELSSEKAIALCASIALQSLNRQPLGT